MKNDEKIILQKKPSKFKYIIAVGVILLLIILALVLSLFQQEPKPDPASEAKIRRIAFYSVYRETNLRKDPNELTDQDFAKINTFMLSGVSAFDPSTIISNYNRIYTRDISDIKLLEKFTNLETLSMQGVHFPKKDIPKWMTFLEKLHIMNPSERYMIDLSPLKKLKYLKRLDLMDTSFKDIKTIEALKNLEVLELTATKVSNLKPIISLKNLTYLNLSHCSVSDLKPLSSLTNLQELYLYNTKISDLGPLKNLRNLKVLNINDCKNIPDKQVEDLQKALPDLKIER